MAGTKKNAGTAQIINADKARMETAISELMVAMANHKKTAAELTAALDNCIAIAIELAIKNKNCDALNKIAKAVYAGNPNGYAKTMQAICDYLTNEKGAGLPKDTILYIKPTNSLICRPQELAAWLENNPDRLTNAPKFSDWQKAHKPAKVQRSGHKQIEELAARMVKIINAYHLDVENSDMAEIKRIMCTLAGIE